MKLHKCFGIAALVCLAGAVITGCQMVTANKEQESALDGAGFDEDLDFGEEEDEAESEEEDEEEDD